MIILPDFGLALAVSNALLVGLEFMAGDAAAAIPTFTRLRDQYPEVLQFHTALGQAQLSAGQTKAAHTLTPNIPGARHVHWEQPRVGHYGIFNGRKWREKIAPVVEKFIAANA